MLRELDGGWSQISGAHAVRQLHTALHPAGVKEGALRLAMGETRLLRGAIEEEHSS